MKTKNYLWFGLVGGLVGAASMVAIKKRKKAQTKTDIIRSILTGHHWYISKKKVDCFGGIGNDDVFVFFDNGVIMNLGSKKTYSLEQKEYTSIGTWTQYGKLLEMRWKGPQDFNAYRWVLEVEKSTRLLFRSVISGDVIELTTILNPQK